MLKRIMVMFCQWIIFGIRVFGIFALLVSVAEVLGVVEYSDFIDSYLLGYFLMCAMISAVIFVDFSKPRCFIFQWLENFALLMLGSSRHWKKYFTL